MSIHFVVGKPGSGKSLYSTRRLFEILRDTDFDIVTNLPLNIDKLQTKLADALPDTQLARADLCRRIRILNDDQTREFYRYRGRNSINDEWSTSDPPHAVTGAFAVDFTVKPVAYFIDECQNFFGARDWQKIGPSLKFYCSQHRHLGDLVFFITQSVHLVDKQMRLLAQDFAYLTNHRKMKVWGFKSFPWFAWKIHPTIPTGQNDFVCESGRFFLKASDYELYDTSAGFGAPGGRKADTQDKAKGPSLAWLFVAILCGALLVWWLPDLAVRSLVGGTSHPSPPVQPSRPPGLDPFPAQPTSAPTVSPTTNLPPVRVRLAGTAIMAGVWHVYLSDGRSFRSGDTALEYASARLAVINGQAFEP